MLTLSHLRKSFGPTLAVDDLSLTINKGEVFGLLGPNGAGKTTTISMAVGLIAPDSGTVDLNGLGSPVRAAVRASIGVAPQSIALYDDLTADENLDNFGSLYDLPRATRRTRAGEVLELVGLTDRRADRVKAYSSGMKRRLNLAAALMHDPPLLMLDEPTAGVDPQSRNAILDVVRDLASRGRTVVYTTHYMEEAARLCDRVGIIDQGKLLACGTVDELVGRLGGKCLVTIQSESGDSRVETANPVAELSARLAAPGVRGVKIDRPDLEAVFLHMTGRSLRD